MASNGESTENKNAIIDMDMQYDWLIVNCSSPYGSGNAQESLDLALAAGTFEQNVALLFSGDGVFQLLKGQSGEDIHRKNLQKMLSSTPIFGIRNLFVSAASLEELNIEPSKLIDTLNFQILDNDELSKLFSTSKSVIRF